MFHKPPSDTSPSNAPLAGTPQSGTPQSGTSQSGTPKSGTPKSGTSQSGASQPVVAQPAASQSAVAHPSVPQRGPDQPLLLVHDLTKRFGGFHALDGVSFDVRPGEILGLVGPNGSGKTTCINVITGLYAPDGGTVTFQGRRIGGWPSHKLARLGVNRTYQIPKAFRSLTILENVQVAATYSRRGMRTAEIQEVLELLKLKDQADRRADELTSVHLKMLDLARALATKPVVLCLDELAAGFNPAELADAVTQVRTIADSGVAIIVVEHLMGFIQDVTDRVIVLNAGKGIFQGSLVQATQNREVIDVFLGDSDAL